MRAGTSQTTPSLEGVRRRFERWRRRRKIGSRIPEPLWDAAGELAESCGVHRTAKTLGVDYYCLKKRLEKKSASGPRKDAATVGAGFLELPASSPVGVPECLLELEDVDGVKMRIHLKGIGAGDLTALSRSLWAVE